MTKSQGTEDDRATTPPDEQGDSEPTPGDDGGPQGNPAQDEEALRHQQQESDQYESD